VTHQAKPKAIPFRPMFEKQMQDPSFRAAYDGLEDEFAFAAQIIGARAKANLTQEELGQRMNTTQSAIARLESGRTAPSTTTLKKFAKARGGAVGDTVCLRGALLPLADVEIVTTAKSKDGIERLEMEELGLG
jgi:transcriptional regulator with XRE-family HTH domain